MGAFKNWIKLDEIKLGSDGQRDNQATQTSAATQQVAQNWMANRSNADAQGQLMAVKGNKSVLGKDLLDVGTQAVDAARPGQAQMTTAPMVGSFIGNSMGLPSVIKPPKPTQVKMMRRK